MREVMHQQTYRVEHVRVVRRCGNSGLSDSILIDVQTLIVGRQVTAG
jgi:hypothetical protein